MPNRILRDWTNSDKVNVLSYQAEVFFLRLIMKADDYGCYWADEKRLKANLFVLKIDNLRETDISRWMAECQKAGLIVVYEVESKRYLQVVEFNQRKRIMKRHFPCPPDDGHLTDIRPPEVEDEVEKKKEVEDDNGASEFLIEQEKHINNSFFIFFRRAAGSHISDKELRQEIGKFRNKYPNSHPNESGALINTWVANIGRQPKPEKKMVL